MNIFKNFNPKTFSLLSCIGGVSYGFYLGNFFLVIDSYPNEWKFQQDLNNINYSLFNSLFPSGSFIGTILAGYFSFRFGRVKSIMMVDLVAILASILVVVSNENLFQTFFIGRFLTGVSNGANYPLMLILLKEFLIEREYLKHIVYFQTSNTIGIFASTMLCLSNNWKLSPGIAIIFPILRFLYFFHLFREKIDSPLYVLHNNNGKEEEIRKKECLDLIEKLYPTKNSHDIFLHFLEEKTLLKENFFMGNMFHMENICEILLCISILFLNQSSGINQVLGYSGLFFVNYRSIPILFSIMTLIGGLSLLYSIPPKNLTNKCEYFIGMSFHKGFARFLVGMVLLVSFLGIFSFAVDFKDNNDVVCFTVVGCIFLLVFQHCVGLYPFLYIPFLLPDIGVFMVLIIHSTFGMMISLTFYFGTDSFSVIFKFCFISSILVSVISFVIYWIFFRKKMLLCDLAYDLKKNDGMNLIPEKNEEEENLNKKSSIMELMT